MVCGFAPYQHGHVWREYIGSLQFDLAQTYKVHLSEWNTGGPLGLMAPRPPRQCEVVSPSRNDRVDLENPSSWQGEWSYIPAEAAVEQVTRGEPRLGSEGRERRRKPFVNYITIH